MDMDMQYLYTDGEFWHFHEDRRQFRTARRRRRRVG
jgi:hypothetical protein